MTALDKLIQAYDSATDDSKCADVTYFGNARLAIMENACKEQAELVAALRPFADLCDGDLQNVGGGVSLGFDGRLTASMIKAAKETVARFPSPDPVDTAPSTSHCQGPK